VGVWSKKSSRGPNGADGAGSAGLLPFPGLVRWSREKALKLGDYSIAGMEEVCVVERKERPDLVHSCTTDRCIFTKRLRRMSQYPHRLLLITSSLSQIKSPIPMGAIQTESRNP